MQEFYRKASSIQEHFILRNLNIEIEDIINNYICEYIQDGKVLDIGCGEQPLKRYFNKKGFNYKGLDYRQNSLGTVDYITKIDDQELIIDELFDVIICTEVMEHVLDWKVAFANMGKLCARNGLVLITCPMFYPLHEEPFDFWRPTPYAITAFAKLNGFSVLKEKRVGDGKDLLGTLLSYSYFYPQNKRLITLISTKLINRARNYFLKKIHTQSDSIIMESPFFMSNLFLLQKE